MAVTVLEGGNLQQSWKSLSWDSKKNRDYCESCVLGEKIITL